MIGTALTNAQLTHPVTSGSHDSKYAFVPKANILNTWCKLICVEKNEEIAYLMDIYVIKHFHHC